MDTVRPLFKKLLIAAIVIYVAGTAFLISDLCYKVGRIEDIMVHMTGKHADKH